MAVLSEYQAIHEGAAVGAVAPRRQIAVAGADRRSYLQGMLTNDIQALAPGSGCYAAWLTPQGRMLTDMHVLESDEMLLLDVPAEVAEAVMQRLDQFIFTEDVRVELLAESMTNVWLHGPAAASVLERTLEEPRGLAGWTDYQHARGAFRGVPVVVARISQLGVPGFCVYLHPSHQEALLASLTAAGAVVAGRESIEAARIEARYPVYGVDMTEETIPLEAGIEQRAISFSKGCYVGQEIIIRVLHRGGGRVARKLVGLRIAGSMPDRGAKVFSGDRAIGSITSAADSPRSGVVALAYVHRDFVEPETALDVEAQARRVPAVVTGA
jgi:tRNA-modifying protein YgfZ